MIIEHVTKNNILILTPEANSLKTKLAFLFKEKAMDLILTNDKNQVIIDLQHLQIIDTSGLGSILSIVRLLTTQGGDLKISEANPIIRTTFEIVSMHKICKIYNSTEEAISSFEK